MHNGIFETIAIHHGKPVFLNAHLNRLEYALRNTKISAHYNRTEVAREIYLRAKNKDRIAVKLVLDDRGLHFYERENPYTAANYQRGFDVCLSTRPIDERAPKTYIKSTDRAVFDEEREKAIAKGYDEVIFCNQKGWITEGSVSNIFCVKNGAILTPSVSSGLLDGIVRRFLVSLFGAEIRECIVTKEDLYGSEELFLTNSLMGIMPVRSLEGKPYLTGGKGTKISEYYQALIETPAHVFSAGT